MRLNNFSNNSLMQSKQQQNTKESIGLESETQIESDIKIRLSNENRQFRPKDKHFWNRIFSNQTQLVSQNIKQSKFSSFDVLGIIMLKIMTNQLIHNGYSSTKLSIIKAINDIQLNKIQARYFNQFNVKVNSYQLMAILNKSLKQINQELSSIRSNEKQVNFKSYFQYEIVNIKIHKTIMKHIKSSSILPQFFHIFFTSLLLLVNYPIEKISLLNQNMKQIMYILCDYLSCKISQNSQNFIIDQTHFIYSPDNFIYFGNLHQNYYKGNKSQNDRLLQKNLETRSTHELLSDKKVKRDKNTHSTGCKHTPKELSSKSSKGRLKKSFLFTDQEKTIKNDNKFQVNCQQSRMSHFKLSNGILNRKRVPTKVSSTSKLLPQKNNTSSFNQILQRKSVGFTNVNRIEWFGFKCKKCLMKKQLNFVSKVVNFQL